MQIDSELVNKLSQHFDAIQQTHGVKILYACESGSRAWGFASPNSDYDVRFIYHYPRDRYLSLRPPRDTIERIDGDIDLAGWDIRKTLGLLMKSNPPLLEWLGSPIVYTFTWPFLAQLRELSKAFYSPMACIFHYYHMANGNYKKYLNDGETVWVKKYFYVLRPLLAVEWIENELGIVPMEFSKLVETLVFDQDLRIEINELLALKRAGNELRHGPRYPAIDNYITTMLDKWNNYRHIEKNTEKPLDKLDELFLDIVTC